MPVRVMKCWMLGVNLKSTGSSLCSSGGWSAIVENEAVVVDTSRGTGQFQAAGGKEGRMEKGSGDVRSSSLM